MAAFVSNLLQCEKPRSSLGFKYPTLRDHPLHTPALWLEGKRADDDAEGLWRIHDDLYDFTNFVHPGGPDWLILTKGTDITEAFESHHISTLPQKYLLHYHVRKASAPRNSPFSFKENGFYKTLKRKIRKELENVPETPETRSKVLVDSFLFMFLVTAIFSTMKQSYVSGIISGIFLTMTCIGAHNFFHKRDNFRMHYFDLAMMSSRDWRVSHALSHHLYTNTIYDLEISSLEPFLQYLPSKKSFFTKYISWLYSPLFYSLLYFGHYLKTIFQAVIKKESLRKENYFPWIVLMVIYYLSGQSFGNVLKIFLWIEFVSSFFFGLIGLNAGHHHPDLFHDGDATRPKEELDWGIHQMDTVMDRADITGSHFLVLISFGDHALHHLFPTIDHGKLEYLYPVFKETCKEFGIEFKMTNQLTSVKGQFLQLAKVEPNENAPTSRNI